MFYNRFPVPHTNYLNLPIDKSEVDEIILGQAKQTADLSYLASVASLRAQFPESVPGYTVHRQCGSRVQAVKYSRYSGIWYGRSNKIFSTTSISACVHSRSRSTFVR